MADVVIDDFNRANSNTVGGGWTEYEEVATDLQIESNTLRMGRDSAAANARAVTQGHGTLTYPVTLYYKISALNNAGRRLWTTIESSDALSLNGMGAGIRFLTNTANNVSILHGGGETRTQVNLDSNVDYYVWTDYTDNGSNIDIELYISTSATKPASPTLSAINVARADAGNFTNIYFDVSAAGQEKNIDDFQLTDAAAGGAFTKPNYLGFSRL